MVSVLILSFNVLAVSEDECLAGGGEWTTPQNVDLREGDTRQPYCKCSQGSQWDGEICKSIPQKILCESSDGKWVNNECMCPENSVGWDKDTGCNYIQSPQNNEISEETSESFSVVKLVLVIVLLFLVIFIIVKEIKRYLRKKKKHERLENE